MAQQIWKILDNVFMTGNWFQKYPCFTAVLGKNSSKEYYNDKNKNQEKDNYNDNDKDKDKDESAENLNICYIFEKLRIQGYQIW